MGFNKVYKCLMEMFPQIDTRLLKAVAIEHSKDADTAANVVLAEILPCLLKLSLPVGQSASSSTPMNQSPSGHSDGDERAEPEEQSNLCQRIVARRKNEALSSSIEPGSIISGSATNMDLADAYNTNSTYLSKALNASKVSHVYDSQLFVNNESEEVILLGTTQDSGHELGSDKVSIHMPNALTNVEGGNADLGQVCANTESSKSVPLGKGQDINVKVDPEQTSFSMSTFNGVSNSSSSDWKDFDGPGVTASDTSYCGINHLLESSLDCPLVKIETSVAQLDLSSVQEQTSDFPECVFESEIGSVIANTDCGIADSSDLISKQENPTSEKDDFGDESTTNRFITRSGQMCRIDLLEHMIEDAKNNKKTLFAAMESVMNLIREVEIQEKAAEEAKLEAGQGGLDILVKVEELEQMLAHAREANNMHAGEIYGEKAILATEARELQNRLLGLSEERDKSLTILDEMRESLEARLAAAQEMKKAAEQEKLEKEESAQNSFAEQEAMMEKVVQESKILQNQAEENSKLREFLMDRGRVVDSLQGEISVICQDVILLKEKFDDRVPLSKSISSSHTTCILASSSSSVKNMASSLLTEQGMPAATPRMMSPTPSVDAQSLKSRLEEGRIGDEWKELSDDGWDVFDKEETELNCKAL